jgi:hypothetical protein
MQTLFLRKNHNLGRQVINQIADYEKIIFLSCLSFPRLCISVSTGRQGRGILAY